MLNQAKYHCSIVICKASSFSIDTAYTVMCKAVFQDGDANFNILMRTVLMMKLKSLCSECT